MVKKAEIVLTLINDTGKVLDTDFRCCNDPLLKCGKTKKEPNTRETNQETTEVPEKFPFR